ncbi:1,4-dihydroxy-2-naphthoyl-CoA synthase [Rhodoligotrophos appendicifer]|uniref:enoyl-CoA hydratase-related protein n=1 Tax=Rhodoligotrophos appendicifer TaxID=987056 RepID=UPI00195FA235|nr:enoyl-CoA hydratase-related protein [Rhodoligotrophos appendicifer]
MTGEQVYDDILVERRGMVGWITINRPDRFNALDHKTFSELAAAFKAFGHEKGIGVVVITGAGEKSFSAGGFLGDLANFSTEQGRLLFDAAHELLTAMRRIPQPVIAAVNGFAMGGGNEIVICSDLAISAEHARFGQTGPRIGSSPVFGATNLLGMTIGEKKAREVCYLCRQYTAQEAFDLGWINKVVPAGELEAEVQRWCEELLDKSPAYLELSKITSNVWWEMLSPAMEHAKQALIRMAGGPEMTEGASAFMEKRKPDFRQFRRESQDPAA